MAQLLSNLPIRALIKFGAHSVGSEAAQPIIWMIADKNHSGYPSNSVSLITEKIIDLRAYDAQEGSTTGNINYQLSNIHQWLNSDATAGNWYTPTHSKDAPPTGKAVLAGTGYQDRPGFLYNFTLIEQASILPTTLTVQTGKDISSKISAKVFLASSWEILGSGDYADGSTRLSCFTTSGDVKCNLTNQAYTYTACETNYKPSSADTYWTYVVRSTSDKEIKGVSSEGYSCICSPYAGSSGIRPLINLSANTKISDTTDADGCYSVLSQSPPSISGTNGDLGIKAEEFIANYTVTDTDNEPVTVTEYIDNIAIRSYVATLGAENTFSVTGATWLKLTNGTHTLKIVATDGFDTDTRVYTFTKSVTKLVVQRRNPIESSNRPSQIIVTVVKNIPYNAIMTVEVCNNGFDANPTWENIGTSSVSSGLAYEFENETCTSGKWGVNIRVTVDRNGGEGACYITEIGGNFE